MGDSLGSVFPSFEDLPLDPSGPTGNAWGRFGKDDDLGMLNLLTPAVVVRASQEIKLGVRVSLDWPLGKPAVPGNGRQAFEKQLINRARGDGLRVVNDDVLTFNTQSGSQWDGFRHFGDLKAKRYYNNVTHGAVYNSNALGIDAWANGGGIVGRGILIDYASWAQHRSIRLSPFNATEIPFWQLQQVIEDQKTTFMAGDILFIRTGFTAAFNGMSEAEQNALAERSSPAFAGIEASERMLRFLWANQFAAVAGDAPALERCPLDYEGPFCLHQWLLARWGMPIGEMFDLEELSAKCKELGRYSFFVASVPLKVPGGVASPPNAIAIF